MLLYKLGTRRCLRFTFLSIPTATPHCTHCGFRHHEMPNMQLLRLLLLTPALVQAQAATHTIEAGNGGFLPSQVTALPGDVIKFHFKDAGHGLVEGVGCKPTPGGFDTGIVQVSSNIVPFTFAKCN